jgi:hypothetical protein
LTLLHAIVYTSPHDERATSGRGACLPAVRWAFYMRNSSRRRSLLVFRPASGYACEGGRLLSMPQLPARSDSGENGNKTRGTIA